MSSGIAEDIRIALIKNKKNVAWLANEIGVSPQDVSNTIRNLEDGKTITVEKLEKISKALGITFTIGA